MGGKDARHRPAFPISRPHDANCSLRSRRSIGRMRVAGINRRRLSRLPEGYSETEGKIDPEKALMGSSVGWRGPWGTTYATNLRIDASVMSERGFVGMLKRIRTSPPMPWYNLRAMEESDMQSLYQYIRSLGKHGKPAPSRIRPDKEPTTPYVQLVPPQTPKN